MRYSITPLPVTATLSFFILLVAILAFTFNTAVAQKTTMPPEKGQAANHEEEAVLQVINNLFDAMRAGDGEKVSSLFVDDATLQRVGSDREGKPHLGNTPASAFAEAVGQPHDEVWDERIWNTKINIDGRLASAWMNFAFYLGDTFRHCGVNSFQLFNGEDGWKIIYLADTSQRSGCEIPEHVESGGN